MSDLQVRGPLYGGTGTPSPFTADLTGAQRVTDAHGRYAEAVRRGNVFFAANQAIATFGATLVTTTALGMILSNPVNSGKNLELLLADLVVTATLAIGQVGISVMPYSALAVTHTTALTIKNALLAAGPASVANADSGATLPLAPTVARLLAAVLTTTAGYQQAAGNFDLAGSLIITPGTAAAILSSASLSGLSAIYWEEVPIITG